MAVRGVLAFTGALALAVLVVWVWTDASGGGAVAPSQRTDIQAVGERAPDVLGPAAGSREAHPNPEPTSTTDSAGPAAAEREVATLTVQGLVTMPDGRLASGARVILTLSDVSGSEVGRSEAFTNADGQYAIEIASDRHPRDVEVVAQAGQDGRVGRSMFQIKLPEPLFVARVRRPWPARLPAVLELDLFPVRGGSIAALVLDVDGRPTSAEAELVCESGEEPARRRQVGANGEMRVGGLLGLRYTLEVRKRGWAAVRVTGILPDGPLVTVHIDQPATARVLVRIEADVELAETIVLSGELRPPAGREVEAPELPTRLVVDEPFGWPEEVAELWYGVAHVNRSEGRIAFGLSRLEGRECEFAVDGGLWWFGAKGKAFDGNLLMPAGSGLVRVAPGEHTLVLRLVSSGSVEGRLVTPATSEERWLALARPGGPPIPLDVRNGDLSPLRRSAEDGGFAWPLVPVGPLELRWGGRDELLAGRAQGGVALVVRRGETTTLEIGP